MSSHKKSISVSDIKAGMIAAADIYERNNMLLAKDQPITELVLTQLKKSYLINSVEVYVESDSLEKKLNNNISFNLKTIDEIENILNSFSADLEKTLDSISDLKRTDIDELRVFTKNIQDKFTATDAILKNIAINRNTEQNFFRHSLNVGVISFILGKWLGVTEKDLNFLMYSAVLHDFGITKLDKSIIEKGSKLTTNEYKIFKTHPIIGYEFIKKFQYLDPSVGYGILMHHERMDGSGYPFGLKNDKIHKFSKIIAIADLFDEISSGSYSEDIRSPFDVLNIIRQESFEKLDFNYCNMFLRHMTNFYIGEEVILSDKRKCKVVKVNMDDLLNPILLDGSVLLDLSKEKDIYIESLAM
ncbi:HD domain-containing protein [Clostridium sp. 19966]|uniref:HD-GYP domain-containing protein n=1 Tax=Clostridium sp. 19966 TaxID=2768166 RepID=UPI0028DFF10A|nr:HD domain-containing phosphohydrolase [Clostridium sp. 19966]MDT8718064.1 HD domain-containing protein [Clostridium sp. 19966]